MDTQLIELAQQFSQCLKSNDLRLAVAESCTAGGLAYALTEIPGSSAWFDRGFVCYSNAAKTDMLGVNPQLIADYGAVSRETALAMAAGALQHSQADIAIAITGIAGPEGGTPQKPVGTVFIGIQQKNQDGQCYHCLFSGNRSTIRQQVIAECLRIGKQLPL